MPATTFAVANVPLGNGPTQILMVPDCLAKMLAAPVEAMSLNNPRLIRCDDSHPFAAAAHDAFYDHLPLMISPDDIWFCIAQGFAHHVKMNARALRHKLVSHSGRMPLVVERRDFRVGGKNPWPEAFAGFSRQIGEQVGEELRQRIVARFSTSTPFHVAATDVLLMDTFQPFFEYEMRLGCGIPFITLTGTPADWQQIRRRAAELRTFDLDAWMDSLLPLLDRIEAAARGEQDQPFWNSFFRYRSGSMGSALTGWINVLFPYLRNDGKPGAPQFRPNPYMSRWNEDYVRSLDNDAPGRFRRHEPPLGPVLGNLPSGLASAPVKCVDMTTGATHIMRFVAGMFGVAQDQQSKNLSAAFGWAVLRDKDGATQAPARKSRWWRLFR